MKDQRLHFIIFLLVFGSFLCLAKSALSQHKPDTNVGYTKSEVEGVNRLVAKAGKEAERHDKRVELTGQLFQMEPDGSPEEVKLYHRDGSAAQ